VMLGGPTMNVIIYLILTVLLFTLVGKPGSSPTITSVVQCVVAQNSADAKTNTCPVEAPASPAAVLQPGDRVLAINGKKIDLWEQAVPIIERSAGKKLTFTIERAGVEQSVSLTPVENLKYASNGTTLIHAGYIGVQPSGTPTFIHESITQVPGEIGSQLSLAVHALASYPQKIHSLWQTVFEGKQRDPNGAIGVVGIGELGGQVASHNNLDLTQKLYTLFSILASVNLLLFFFNLLPLVPLDGGHVAGALVEAAKRGRARLRSRNKVTLGPDGQPLPREHSAIYVDTAQMLPVMYAVASVLIVLTLLIFYADIVKPIRLN
jgi:membrane-associated protease RseP (regulator of RpoE activity)